MYLFLLVISIVWEETCYCSQMNRQCDITDMGEVWSFSHTVWKAFFKFSANFCVRILTTPHSSLEFLIIDQVETHTVLSIIIDNLTCIPLKSWPTSYERANLSSFRLCATAHLTCLPNELDRGSESKRKRCVCLRPNLCDSGGDWWPINLIFYLLLP